MLKTLFVILHLIATPFVVAESSVVLKINPLYIYAEGRCFRFQVEIADSARTREQGLMFRKFLAADAGMLFVFPADHNWTMWMSNTLIPLDILFINADGVIEKIHHSASPHTETHYRPDKPVRFALEVNGGTARKLNLKEGERLYHELIPHPMPSQCQTAITINQVAVAQKAHQATPPAVKPAQKPVSSPVTAKP